MDTKSISSLPLIEKIPVGENILFRSNGILNVTKPQSVFVLRPEVSNLNDAIETGYYRVFGPDVPKNSPEFANYGVLLVFKDSLVANEFVQLLITVAPSACMYVRKHGSGSSWSPWNKVTTSVVTSVSGGG